MIDIRHVPTYYINCSSQIEKRRYMEEELSINDFTNYKRFAALECRDGRAGCFLSHMRCAYMAMEAETSKYVLILEDDVKFNDIEAINVAVNKAILSKDFDVFVCVESNMEQVHIPPKEKCFTTHFLLYNRQHIPAVLNIFYTNWLKQGILDQWEPNHRNVAIYYTNACKQNDRFESSIHNCWNSYIIITDSPLKDNAYVTISDAIGRKIPWSDIAPYAAYSFDGNIISYSINDGPIKIIQLDVPIVDKLITALTIHHSHFPYTKLYHIWDPTNRNWINYDPVME